MKRSKSLILLSTITLICLFATATICNLGSGTTDEEEKSVAGEAEESAAAIEDTGSAEEPGESTEEEPGESTESLERDNQPPTVTDITFSNVIIIPGETYDVTYIAEDPDGDDLVCEWGVSAGTIADMYANPMKWTTPDEEDTVLVTVRIYDNNGGTDARSEEINVRYQQIEAEMSNTFQMEFPLVASESGNIRFGDIPDMISDGWVFGTGDTHRNQHMKCFASFDISSFQGGEIQKAILTLKYVRSIDISFWNSFDVYSVSWGPRTLKSSDYHLLGTLLASYPISPPGDLICEVPLLKQKLVEAIGQGSTRFQVMFFLSPALSNNNDLNDGWTVGTDSSLKITYESQ